MLGRRGSLRGLHQLDSGGEERRGSISSATGAPTFPGRRGSISSSSAAAAQAATCAAGGRRGSISSTADSAAGGRRGCVSSSNITGGGTKNAGGTLAMIALPIPAPRVRKVPILMEKDGREGQIKGQEQKEEILDAKDKSEGGTWKARTGLSPGKWATRSLRRSKEEAEVKVLPLQRRGSLRGSLRLGRRGEEEENKQMQKSDGKKKKEEGGGEVRQKVPEKERRPLLDLNKAEKKPLGERERKPQGDSKDRKPLTDLNQTGGRRASISAPHQQVGKIFYQVSTIYLVPIYIVSLLHISRSEKYNFLLVFLHSEPPHPLTTVALSRHSQFPPSVAGAHSPCGAQVWSRPTWSRPRLCSTSPSSSTSSYSSSSSCPSRSRSRSCSTSSSCSSSATRPPSTTRE